MKKKEARFLLVNLIAFVFIIGFNLFTPLKAQVIQEFEIGFFGGGAYYIGDINPRKHFNDIKPALGFVARFEAGTRWAFRFNYTNSEITASDLKVKYREERMLAFKTTINDFSLLAEFNFLPYFIGSKRNYFTPYIFGGFSVFLYEPRTLDGEKLRPIQTEGSDYNKMSMSIPFGFGFKYSLAKRIGIALEWRMHKTFTDYIDDVSDVYPGPIGGRITSNRPDLSDPSGNYQPGMQRGNKKDNDWFSYAGVMITYKIRIVKKQNCNNFNQQTGGSF